MERLIEVSHYLPILTTVISGIFGVIILERYNTKKEAKHLLWWGVGVLVYGAGTLVESLTTLFGWHEYLFKSWYIVGALLGGAPLAVGTIYLLLGRKTGNISAMILTIVAAITSIFIILSPINYSLVDPDILNGKVFAWQNVRLVSPFINGFAAIFLIGGAIYSAGRFFKDPATRNRFIGNVYIAIGALLPGIGGMISRIGYTEALYIGELIGIILIWSGYNFCQKKVELPSKSLESAAVS